MTSVNRRTLSAVTSFFGPRRHSHSLAVVAAVASQSSTKSKTTVERNKNNNSANECFLDSGVSSNKTSTTTQTASSLSFTPRQSWRASISSSGGGSGGGRAAVDHDRGDQSWMMPPPSPYSSESDNNHNNSSMLLLIDLLQQKDVFAKSWSEPDRRERRRRRDGGFVDDYYHVNTTRRQWEVGDGGDYDEQYRRSPTVEKSAIVSTTTTATNCDTINDNKHYQQQQQQRLSTPIEIEYNTLLQQTESLLLSLSSKSLSSSAYDYDNNNSAQTIATLQLMDFDNVMMKWSRLHTISGGNEKEKEMEIDMENISSSSISSSSMKRNASDQCLRLLHALENNYDCILDNCLLSLSTSTVTKEKFNKDKDKSNHYQNNNKNNYPRHCHIMPNATSYNLTLHTMANNSNNDGRTTNVSYEAYTILLRMINRCKRYIDNIDSLFLLDNNSNENENTSIVTRVQTAVAKGLLPPPPCEPTIITMNSVIHAIARSNTSDAGHFAEEVYKVIDLWSMECKERQRRQRQLMSFVHSGHSIPNNSKHNNNNRVWLYQGVIPNARTLACTIDAWANSKSIKTTTATTFAPERADAILQLAINQRRTYVNELTTRMKQKQVNVVQEHFSDNNCMEMNIIDYVDDIVEDEWYNNNDDDDDVKEEIVIDELRQQPKMEDSASSILSLLPSLSTVNEDTSTLPVLTDIIDRRPLSPPPPLPNTLAFNSCIHAWSNSGRGREGAVRAEELLFQLQSLSESGELNPPPTSGGNTNHELTSSINDYATDGIVAQEVEKEDEDVAGLSPNVRTYTMVMTAWANAVTDDSGIEAATRCENILIEMEKQGANNLLVRPNLVAYVITISAWARTSCGDNNIAASHAEFILNRMIDLYYNHVTLELPALDGDIVNANHDAPFNSVITCYARCAYPNSTERAFAILERLIVSPIQPTVTTFNSVLDVCAKHGDPDRALDVLNKMKEMSIRPDLTSYDTVLNAFGRCSYPDSANKAYDFLCKLENSPDEYNYKPSILSYSTVINAFARVSGKDSSYGGLEAVKKAKEIYDRLIYKMENGLIHGVDPFSNSCLLNCCANVYGCESDKKAALVIAINLFEEMKKRPELHGEPNQYTFGTMMKVCARLSMDDDEKHRLMENLFIQACKRGACSKAVIGQFLRNTPTHLNMNVILSLGGNKRDIPHSWYRNVARRQWPTLM